MREIVLDTETTGLDPNSGHRVVEIGCVELINHVRTGNYFHTYLNPERDMPAEAERIHGLSTEFLKDKPTFAAIAGSFLEFISDAPLVIHNAAFDLKFVNWELNAIDLPQVDAARATDTVLLARQKFPGQPANLDALCRRFAIDLGARTKHGALLDAELLAEVYLELRGGRQSALSLAAQATGQGAEIVFSGHTDIPLRSFPPTMEELAAHEAMLAKIPEALWKKLG